ncbi:MAG: hypothetical protein Q8K32_30220 [Archangium sp.]|nr:hypothetical protein [Archangium sp.]
MHNLPRLVLGAAAVSSLIIIACGAPPRDRVLDILPDNPTGQIGGTPWTMTKASVRRSGEDGGTLDVKLFGMDVADCASSSPDAGYIIFNMPAKVGKRTLQLSLSDLGGPDNQTITFVTPPSSNNIAVDGVLNVTEVTQTSLTMGLLAKGGKTTDVNGTFTATFCQ